MPHSQICGILYKNKDILLFSTSFPQYFFLVIKIFKSNAISKSGFKPEKPYGKETKNKIKNKD